MKIESFARWFSIATDFGWPLRRLGKLPMASTKLAQLRRKLLRKLADRLKSSNADSATEQHIENNP